jgi:hypothetical protein
LPAQDESGPQQQQQDDFAGASEAHEHACTGKPAARTAGTSPTINSSRKTRRTENIAAPQGPLEHLQKVYAITGGCG